MFPSNNSPDDFKYTDHTMFFTDVSPNSFHFSPTFPDNIAELLFDDFPQHLPMEIVTNMAASTNNDMEGSGDVGSSSFPLSEKTYHMTAKNPRKRNGKKDRHSKVITSRGPRDRRMRLSLDIARRFFDLQDILGFDKASKTVDWLLTKSKEAITELSRGFPQCKHSCIAGAKSDNSTSQCELALEINKSEGKSIEAIGKDKKIKQKHKAIFHGHSRESREKARARARERTLEKVQSRKFDKISKSPFERGEESGSYSNDIKSSLDVTAQWPVEDIVEESFLITEKSSSVRISNYHHEIAMSQGVCSNNSFLNFHENWGIDDQGMDLARAHPSYCAMANINLSTGNAHECRPSSIFLTNSDIGLQSQFADIQLYGKPCDHYDN